MKTLIFNLIVLSFTAQFAIAQNKPIDRLFEKYADREGFTTVFISKDMFKLFAKLDSGNSDEFTKAVAGVEGIKILTAEGTDLNHKINFFDELRNQIPFNEYSTLLSVKEKGQELRMMVKEEGGRITEFLMLGGGDDNVLISIVGDIDLNSISKISGGLNIQGLQNLDKIDKKEK